MEKVNPPAPAVEDPEADPARFDEGPSEYIIEQANHEETDTVPDGGYGWVCVLSVCIVNGFTWGVLASYGVCLQYYLANNIFPEATSLDFALIGGLEFGAAMLVSSPVTAIARVWGTHAPMFAGVALQTGGYIAASFADRIWELYLSQGVLVGMGVGFLFIPSVQVVSQWFERKRSVANGICSAGSGIGGIIFSFATAAAIRNISLSWALRIIGLSSGAMNLLATCLIRNRNKVIRPPMHPFDLKLLRRPKVMILLSWGFVSMLGYMTLLYSLPDFSRSIGLNNSQAAATSAFLNLGTAVGRPAVGILSDRFGRIEVAGLMTLLCGVTVFTIWLPATSYGVTVFFAIVNGAILGVFWMTISPLCVVVAGLKELPSMQSLAWATVLLPTTFSEVIALYLRRPGSDREYLYPQIFSGTAYTVAALLMLWLWCLHRRDVTKP